MRQKLWGHNKVSVGSWGARGVAHIEWVRGHSRLPLRRKECIVGPTVAGLQVPE